MSILVNYPKCDLRMEGPNMSVVDDLQTDKGAWHRMSRSAFSKPEVTILSLGEGGNFSYLNLCSADRVLRVDCQ